MTTEPRLLPRAEALLGELAQDVEGRDWEAQARGIVEKLDTVALGSTPDTLLAPPLLIAEPGELAEPPNEEVREAGSTLSLSELARSVAQKPARGTKDPLVKQSLAVAAAARARAPAPRAAVPQPLAASPRSSEPAAVREPAPSSSTRSFLMGAGVAIAAAAVMALLLRPAAQETSAPQAQAQAQAQAEPVAPAAAPPPATAPERSVEAQVAADRAAPDADPRLAAPVMESPAEVALAPQKLALKEAAPERKGAPGAAPRAVAAGAPKAKRAAAAPELVDLAEDAGSAPVKPAEESARLRPAAGIASNTVTDRPSTGAAQAAIGSVLGAARACVAGLAGASTANIVFTSEGSVSKVTLSGPAAGTPAGQCVESALRRARVAPFAQPTYVVSGIQIRP